MAQPVFVIGRNRSGTKWLANVVATHPGVVAVQSEAHGGALEENIFYQVPRAFGPWENDDSFRAFCAFYAQTDFFGLTGVDPAVLAPARRRAYLEVFRDVMDAYAAREGATHWVQKAATQSLAELYEAFPDALFLLTSRDAVDTIRSSVGLRRRANPDAPAAVLREAAGWVLELKRVEAFAEKPRVLRVRYEHLRDDRDGVVARIFPFLGLDVPDAADHDQFRKNTSFAGKEARASQLTRGQEVAARVASQVFRAVPLAVLESGNRLGRVAQEVKPGRRFVAGTFRIARERDPSQPPD